MGAFVAADGTDGVEGVSGRDGPFSVAEQLSADDTATHTAWKTIESWPW